MKLQYSTSVEYFTSKVDKSLSNELLRLGIRNVLNYINNRYKFENIPIYIRFHSDISDLTSLIPIYMSWDFVPTCRRYKIEISYE